MKRSFWLLFLGLFALHHDSWWWNDPSLSLGFLPRGLAWHVLYSLAAAAYWLAALRYSWPGRWERWAESPSQNR